MKKKTYLIYLHVYKCRAISISLRDEIQDGLCADFYYNLTMHIISKMIYGMNGHLYFRPQPLISSE